MAELLERVTIRPCVSKTFPFEPMRETYLEQEKGRTVGKIV
jgi:NADPH:quinone reductase-like Zn-dependent oxidoreductase